MQNGAVGRVAYNPIARAARLTSFHERLVVHNQTHSYKTRRISYLIRINGYGGRRTVSYTRSAGVVERNYFVFGGSAWVDRNLVRIDKRTIDGGSVR